MKPHYTKPKREALKKPVLKPKKPSIEQEVGEEEDSGDNGNNSDPLTVRGADDVVESEDDEDVFWG